MVLYYQKNERFDKNKVFYPEKYYCHIANQKPSGSIMTKFLTIFTVFTVSLGSTIGQSSQVIDSLLLPLYDIPNSKDLSKAPEGKGIIKYGANVLPILASYFTDTTQTKVKSDCQDTYLTRGEIAMILADRTEIMPYALLTGIQNCIFEYCEDNPNFIEYYILAIRQNGVKLFEQKYSDWLISKGRKKWFPDTYKKKDKKHRRKKR